jgi:hypothetical protein
VDAGLDYCRPWATLIHRRENGSVCGSLKEVEKRGCRASGLIPEEQQPENGRCKQSKIDAMGACCRDLRISSLILVSYAMPGRFCPMVDRDVFVMKPTHPYRTQAG